LRPALRERACRARCCHPLHADPLRTEDAEPEEGVEGRDDQGAQDEFPEGAALGNLGQEGAHKWAPRDPPAPIENRPFAEPAVRAALAVRSAAEAHVLAAEPLEGVGMEADLENIPEVVAESLHNGVQAEVGLSQEQHHEQKGHSKSKVHAREIDDAAVEAGDHGSRRKDGDDDNDDNLSLHIYLNAVALLTLATDLACAPTARGGVLVLVGNGIIRAAEKPWFKRCSPWLICIAPKPREVQTPKMVVMIDKMSTQSPIHP